MYFNYKESCYFIFLLYNIYIHKKMRSLLDSKRNSFRSIISPNLQITTIQVSMIDSSQRGGFIQFLPLLASAAAPLISALFGPKSSGSGITNSRIAQKLNPKNVFIGASVTYVKRRSGRGIFDRLGSWLSSLKPIATTLWNGIKNVGSKIGEIVPAIGSLIGSFGEKAPALGNAIKSGKFGEVIKIGQDIIKPDVIQGIVNSGKDIYKGATTTYNDIKGLREKQLQSAQKAKDILMGHNATIENAKKAKELLETAVETNKNHIEAQLEANQNIEKTQDEVEKSIGSGILRKMIKKNQKRLRGSGFKYM